MTKYKKPAKLKEIIYSIINDRDRLDILNHIIKELNAVAGSDPVLDSVLAILTEIRDDLDGAVTRSRVHPSTKKINALHEDREDCIKNMLKGITIFVRSKDAAVSTAAKEIQNALVKHFSKLPDKKKRTLSAAIKRFQNDMKKSGMPEKVDLIHFTEIMNELESDQTEFDLLIEARAKDDEKNESPTLVPAREQMNIFTEILEGHLYLNGYLEVPGTEELIHNLNGRIGDIMTTAKALHTMEENGHLSEKKPEKEEEEDLDPSETDLPIDTEHETETENSEESEDSSETEEPMTRDDR